MNNEVDTPPNEFIDQLNQKLIYMTMELERRPSSLKRIEPQMKRPLTDFMIRKDTVF